MTQYFYDRGITQHSRSKLPHAGVRSSHSKHFYDQLVIVSKQFEYPDPRVSHNYFVEQKFSLIFTIQRNFENCIKYVACFFENYTDNVHFS